MKTYKKLIPQKDQDLVNWGNNFADMPSDCCGLTEADLADFRTVSDDYRAKVAVADKALLASRQATAEKQTSRQVLEGVARPLIRRLKSHPDYTKGIGVKLGIEGSTTSHDINNAAPTLTARDMTGGSVELRFNMRGSDGVNLYYQREQEVEWTLLGRIMASPFQDIRALQTPGKLELRRYTAVYTQKTQEVGRFSEDVIVTCTP
jgi:hypothetical protein